MKDELARAYAAFRETQAPDDRTRAQTWDAIASRIARGETGPVIAVEPPVRSRRPVAAIACVSGLLAAAVVGALLLPAAETIDHRSDRETLQAAEFATPTTDATSDAVVIEEEPAEPVRRPRRMLVPQPMPAPEPEPDAEPDADAPDAALTLPEPEPKRKPPRRRHADADPDAGADAVAVAGADPAPVREEARLLQHARSALARRDPAAALTVIREHTERFPDTTFARERDALELLSECALGRATNIQDRVDAFVSRHRGSALTDRVARACAEKVPR